MIEIQAFKLEHLEGFEPKENFEDLKRDMKRGLADFNKVILSGIHEGKLVCIWGVNRLREGAGELWLIPSVHVDKMPISFFKTTKALIYGFVFPDLNFHRLEIAILGGWKKGYKWAEKLGFQQQGICKAYDFMMRDHMIYYRIA